MSTPERPVSRVVGELTLVAATFKSDEPIPARHTCDGADLSPALSWTTVPRGTRSLALVAEDPDAPGGVFTHWVSYNIPPDIRAVPEGVPRTERPDVGGLQGLNDFRRIGYNGPCPPPGPAHRYRFTVYALDTLLDLQPGASKQQLLQAMQERILDQAEIVGAYQRGG